MEKTNDIVQLKSYSETGAEIGNLYPLTKAKSVILQNNETLETVLEELKQGNQSIDDKLGIVGNFKEVDGVLTYKDKQIVTDVKNILATQILETEDRKFLTAKEKSSLFGIKENIQNQINVLTNGKVRFRGRFNLYEDLIALENPEECDMAFVDNDETINNVNAIYYYTDNKWIRIKKDSDSGGGWIASNTEPVNKQILWVDISSSSDAILKYFNGASWINISGLKEVPASKVIQSKNLRFVSDKSDSILNKLEEDLDTGKLMYSGKIIGNETNYIDDITSSTSSTYSSNKISELLNDKQKKLEYVPENSGNKGKANGYVPLNSLAKINEEFLTIYNYVVDSVDLMNNITSPEHGSICYVELTSELYIYSKQNTWVSISRQGSIEVNKSNYNSTRNPLYDDDKSDGYSIGSIWINTITKKAFICTNAEEENATWELMAGTSSVNVGKVIDFTIEPENFTTYDGKYKYEIPKMDLENDFLQISFNGKQLVENEDYTLISNELKTYILFKQKPESQMNGKIYVKDLNDNQMLKSTYDSNNNGKVDFAEVSDKTKRFMSWEPNTKYELNEFVLYNNSLYSPTQAHTSNKLFEENNWKMLNASPLNLSQFTTNDVQPTSSRNYISTSQLVQVNMIPDLTNKITNNENTILINKKNIVTLTSDTEKITNRLNNLKFTQLIDVPKILTPNAFLKTSGDGSSIVIDTKPLFPIKRIVDSTEKGYDSIDVLKFNNLKMTNQSTEGIFTFELDAKSVNLSDMPTVHEHGKVLVSDENNNKYVLADKEQLTMSIENFANKILESEWEENEGKFEKIVFHDLRSMNLLVSFTDSLFIEDKTITYQLLDDRNIKVFSNTRKNINCVINCALGAGNGYWQYLMDWEKIDFVDDSQIRLDRAFSSSKLNDTLNNYCLKNDYFTKAVSDSKYASKTLEHSHQNKSILDCFDKDSEGNLTFENIKLLTEMNATNISLELLTNNKTLAEIYDVTSITNQHQVQAIIASELLIQNISDVETSFQVKDGTFILLDITLQPKEVQKYNLGISKKIKVFAQGEVSTMLTISAF